MQMFTQLKYTTNLDFRFVRMVYTLLLFFCFCKTVHSQPDSTFFNKYRQVDKHQQSHYFLLQYYPEKCAALSKFKIVKQLNGHLAIVSFADTTLHGHDKCVQSITPANNFWKLSPTLEAAKSILQQQKSPTAFTIVADNLPTLLQSLTNRKIRYQIVSTFSATNAAVIKCSGKDFFNAVLPDPALLFADQFVQPTPDEMVIGYDRSINKINIADYHIPTADGHGITLGIKERSMNELDIDLQQRIQSSILSSPEKDNHATTVATLAGGAGNSFYTGKGTASRCNFFPSSFNNLLPDSSALLQQKNVTIQNHSYGTVIQSFYGAEAMSYDMQTAQNKNLLHVFSSGNSGTTASTTGAYANIAGYANLTGNFKTAKNVITVAAVDTGSNITPFSSSGPLYDGRLAPQVTALGPNGTSEAAAIVSGTVAVLQQVYKDSNAQSLPPASLMKAILYNTCDDIGRKGIDYNSGYGLINTYEAIRCLQQKRYDGSSLQQGQIWTKNITLPAQAANLKVMLCWTDTAALVNNNTALINDLDIELVQSNTGTIYRPWVLSKAANVDSLKSLPLRRQDSLNTSEQITVDLPASGIYQLRVAARKITTTQAQAFHIAYGWDTLNRLQFTSPITAGDIDPAEHPIQQVKWKLALADTNTTGTLAVSYNDGQSWQNLATGIALKSGKWGWALPDTIAVAKLRMTTTFGSFLSQPFVLATVPKLRVDFLCTDSIRLSWQRNSLASRYQLFALRSDTAFIKPVIFTNDTFVVLQKNVHSENIYAVQPVIANGLQAARSMAVNVLNQGVNCYYNTLLASVTGDSIALTLNLNYTTGIDSIRFEKVTASGALISVIAKQLIVNNGKVYIASDHHPATGSNYYRATIWMSGRVVYTEIVSVQTTASEQMIVFPNPVQRGRDIQFLMRDAIGEAYLQISDLTGRVIRKQTVRLAGTITTRGLPAGIYFYRLIEENNRQIANGKILVL